MSSFAIEGNKRSGKNILSTQLGIWCARRVSEYKTDPVTGLLSVKWCPLYANYTIYGYPNFIKYEKPEDLFNVYNAVVIFDELGTTTDSRLYTSQQQILFTHKFAQMEKDGITFIYTAQRSHLIEKRIREQTDYVINCYKHPLTKKMQQTWYDTTLGRDPRRIGDLIGRYRVSPERVYQHYNTFEHVKSNINFEDTVNRGRKSGGNRRPWEKKPKNTFNLNWSKKFNKATQ